MFTGTSTRYGWWIKTDEILGQRSSSTFSHETSGLGIYTQLTCDFEKSQSHPQNNSGQDQG